MSKNKFSAILKCNKILSNFTCVLINKQLDSSYDFKNRMSGFIILFLINQISEKEVLEVAKNNKDKFINLFTWLQCNEQIAKIVETFKSNPNLSIEEINGYKVCFDPFANQFIALKNLLKLDLKLDDEVTKEFVKTGLIYILYSLVDCEIDSNIENILKDPLYENKVKMISNNTILFSNLRQLIMKYCGTKISDFIGLINGLTPKIAK